MAIKDIRENRLKKLKKLERAGMMPFPETTKRTHTIEEALFNFNKLEKTKKQLTLVGRIRSLRQHGKITFFDIQDGTGKIQAYLREDRLGESGYKFFFFLRIILIS